MIERHLKPSEHGEEKNETLRTEKEDKNIIRRLRIGVDYIFEQNPEISKIGTKEQYLKYLETIFPDSLAKDIVYHGTNLFRKDNQKISDLDNLMEGTFFTDNLKYAESYAKYRGGNLIIIAKVNIKNPARKKDCEGLFGFLNEDPSLYGGYSELQNRGFDGLICGPNYDTPYPEIYTNDPEYIANHEKIHEMEKMAQHINLKSVDKGFVVDRNYAIKSSYYYDTTRLLDQFGIKYNLYSVDTINGIAYVNNEDSQRKSYQSVTYLVFNDKCFHQLGAEHDMQSFKEYLSSTKNE